MVYRFGTSLYYANASRLVDDVTALAAHGGPLRWMVLDCAAIGDVDYTAAAVLARVIEQLRKRHVRFAVSTVLGPVREQLDRYGISAALGPDAYYDTPGEALEAFHAPQKRSSATKRRSRRSPSISLRPAPMPACRQRSHRPARMSGRTTGSLPTRPSPQAGAWRQPRTSAIFNTFPGLMSSISS